MREARGRRVKEARGRGAWERRVGEARERDAGESCVREVRAACSEHDGQHVHTQVQRQYTRGHATPSVGLLPELCDPKKKFD